METPREKKTLANVFITECCAELFGSTPNDPDTQQRLAHGITLREQKNQKEETEAWKQKCESAERKVDTCMTKFAQLKADADLLGWAFAQYKTTNGVVPNWVKVLGWHMDDVVEALKAEGVEITAAEYTPTKKKSKKRRRL